MVVRKCHFFFLLFLACNIVVLAWTNRDLQAEVVGAGGRIGSQWLRLVPSGQAVPRGLCAGCLTASGMPIYVAIPSAGWKEVYEATLPSRRSDLVWIGNGLPEYPDTTTVVPHYGILSAGAAPTTSSLSPPTFVQGKHASQVADLLRIDGIQVEVVETFERIQIIAARKLLWASCMWLFCHSTDPPLTLSQVHECNDTVLEDLVKELWPAFQEQTGGGDTIEATLTYMQAYSESMPNAIPSLDLAVSEVKERNGEFMRPNLQPLHEMLLQRHGVKTIASKNTKADEGKCGNGKVILDLKEVKLSVLGSQPESTSMSFRRCDWRRHSR